MKCKSYAVSTSVHTKFSRLFVGFSSRLQRLSLASSSPTLIASSSGNSKSKAVCGSFLWPGVWIKKSRTSRASVPAATSSTSTTFIGSSVWRSGAGEDAHDGVVLLQLCFTSAKATEHLESKGFEVASPSTLPAAVWWSACTPPPSRSTSQFEWDFSSPKYFVKVLSEAEILGAPVPTKDSPAELQDTSNCHRRTPSFSYRKCRGMNTCFSKQNVEQKGRWKTRSHT